MPGLILANGNVGNKLLDNIEGARAFVSRDAGMSWREFVRGAHVFAVCYCKNAKQVLCAHLTRLSAGKQKWKRGYCSAIVDRNAVAAVFA